MTASLPPEPMRPAAPHRPWTFDLLLGIVLAAAAAVRFIGLNWDENQHLHPDERFLTMVETTIRYPTGIAEYFRTDSSPLNPHNSGHNFFVYGTFPIFLVRALGEWLGKTGYDEIYLVGRAAAAGFDLVSVVLAYLIGARLYRRTVGLLAAALVAFSPLLIQHAHFFVVDSFTLTFLLAAFYFAVRSGDEPGRRNEILFGVALGLAMASKISAFPAAGLLVLAGIARVARSEADRKQLELSNTFVGWVLAAAIAFVTFRVFQPYAFSGPGFFGIAPNPLWLGNLAEIRSQASGNVDFPPALQWADRAPIWFALQNMILWGMGIPLGVAGWLGWGWALVRLVRGQGPRHLLPVVWVGAHFLWQSTTFTPSMRYQLPVYPFLALLAAWALAELWQKAAVVEGPRRRMARAAAALATASVVGGTILWALAFTSIYTRPVTRVAASRWIYSHVPGAVNLVIQTSSELLVDPAPVPIELGLSSAESVRVSFTSTNVGAPSSLVLPLAVDLSPELGPKRVRVMVRRLTPDVALLAEGSLEGVLGTAVEERLEVPLTATGELATSGLTEVEIVLEGEGAIRLRGEGQLFVGAPGESLIQHFSFRETGTTFSAAVPIVVAADGHFAGEAVSVLMPYVRSLGTAQEPTRASASVFDDPGMPALATGSVDVNLSPETEGRVEIPLEPSVPWQAGKTYTLRIDLSQGPPLTARGTVIVSESSWDDGLPLGVEGRGAGGRYTGVVQELYWPDDQDYDLNGESDKLQRLVDTLTEGDLLAITSNRQFGTIPRVPIRYPLSTAYYHELLNCPPRRSVASCADRAQPGMVSETLGYELVAVFRSDPTLGPWSVSDQAAEEVFTVYDHPLVLLFRKTDAFSEVDVRDRLRQVDLSRIVPVLPKEAGSAPPDLLMPSGRWQAQRRGGTWSEIFDGSLFWARSEVMTAFAWWVAIFLIGLAAWPLTRAAFPGLRDGGYPIARLVGLLILAWGSWMLGSLRVAAHRPAIVIVLAGLVAASAALVWRARIDLREFWRTHRKEILFTEVLALAFFLLDMGIRLGNPDLWHPSKGGEKPMDLSYLTAVLRSESFPPFDPWFAGGYINYYYFGFVIIGVPIQLLGLAPTVAYNLAIPTLFSLLALAAYTAARNVVAGGVAGLSEARCRAAGIAAAIGLVVLGNLGTARMIYEGWKRIGLLEGESPAGLVLGLLQAGRGLIRFLTLQSPLPYALDSWYWDPSRAIPPAGGEVGPITEFPFFTFLYADLHAHMIALPLTVLGLCWAISWLLAARRGTNLGMGRTLLVIGMGALVFGSLRPTNTWDFPVYLVLGLAAAGIAPILAQGKISSAALLRGFAFAAALAATSVLLFLPYAYWYGQGYTAADLWQGSRTDIASYLTVHGLFLFVLVSWMAWEVRQWMAATPLSSLARWRPWFGTIAAVTLVGLAVMIFLTIRGFSIALIALPLAIVGILLFLRTGQSVGKRVVLAMAVTAVSLTFVVDVVVLRGDISRMNTVFKFYLQVWTLFSVSAGAALVWLWSELPAWPVAWRRTWIGLLAFLVFCAALYPAVAAPAKMRDRMDPSASHRLDGIAFMESAIYYDLGSSFPLAEDARAIRWIQQEIQGTPVIVEAHIPEYRWGSRVAIYTGLPTVLGWKHHQSQQRVVSGDPTTARAIEVSSFYLTTSVDEARAFLQRYGVEYVIVGRLERMYYDQLEPCSLSVDTNQISCDLTSRLYGIEPVSPDPAACEPVDPNNPAAGFRCRSGGMAKFDQLAEAGFLREVYRDGETVIYQALTQ